MSINLYKALGAGMLAPGEIDVLLGKVSAGGVKHAGGRPKGSKNRAAAMRLIDTMTVPENQTKVANLIAYSPTNLAAVKDVDPKVVPWLCTTPDNIAKGFVMSQLYWRDHLKDLTERWTAWKLA